jgi:hypothetical protein
MAGYSKKSRRNGVHDQATVLGFDDVLNEREWAPTSSLAISAFKPHKFRCFLPRGVWPFVVTAPDIVPLHTDKALPQEIEMLLLVILNHRTDLS